MSAANGSARWLTWVQTLQAIAQNGLTYSRDPYDRERFEQVQQVAAAIAAAHSGAPFAVIQHLFQAETGYATPKLDVRGVIFEAGRILLVRERSDGRWTLPGGWVDVGEAPGTAVAKEVLEESGYHVQASKLLMLYDRAQHGHPPHPNHIIKAFFRCDRRGGAPRTGLETSEVAFFGPDDIPANLSLSRVTPQQIARCFAHLANPDWPTDFD